MPASRDLPRTSTTLTADLVAADRVRPNPKRRIVRPRPRRAGSDSGSRRLSPTAPRRVDLAVDVTDAPSALREDVTATSDATRPGEDGIRRTGTFAYALRDGDDGRRHLAPAWLLWALLVGFPVWWALGLGSFIFPVLAVPMTVTLVRRRSSLRYPTGWLLWVLFLGWSVLGLVMFTKSPVLTHPGSNGGRLVATIVMFANYACATVVLLFVGNLTRRELPITRLLRWLSVLFFVTVAGGLLGTFAPHFAFRSPVEYFLPTSMRTDPYIAALVHPAAAQIQAVLGTVGGRAAAPWGYTNFWANNLSLLLIWFVCAWAINAANWRRIICVVVLLMAVVPVIYSLNRGLWIGLVVSVLWVAGRLFLHGRVGALMTILTLTALGAVVFLASPLHTTLQARLSHPESNSIRSYLTTQSIEGANQSPVIGWGGPRKTNGSAQSIAIGKSPNCNQCGDFSIGSNGQLWSEIFYHGYGGAALFYGFFAWTAWSYRRDRSPVAQGGVLMIILFFIYSLFYNQLPSGLFLMMIAVAMMWRVREEHNDEAAEVVTGRRPPLATAR